MGPKLDTLQAGCAILLSLPHAWYTTARREKRDEKERNAVKSRVRDEQTEKRQYPLPQVRKRAVTIPLPAAPPGRQIQRTSDQAQSFFFSKLPFELRQQIYREVLNLKEEKEIVHISSVKERLYHVRCKQSEAHRPNLVGWQHECWALYAVAAEDCACQQAGNSNWAEHPSQNEKLLAFLKTCRRAYSEAIDLLYTDNIFSIRQDITLVHLASVVPPHRLNLIKSLHCDFILDFRTYHCSVDRFDSWEIAWRIISRMQGLKVLQLTISKISDTMPTTYQVATALSPLNVVARVDAFSVDLMWEVPEDLEARLGEVPYEIRSGRVPYTVITPDPRDASCTMMGYAALSKHRPTDYAAFSITVPTRCYTRDAVQTFDPLGAQETWL